MKANWTGHVLRRNWLLNTFLWKTDGRIEMTERRGRRQKQILETKRYWKLKEEALCHNHWRSRFGRGYGPVVRQTTQPLYRPGELLRVPGDWSSRPPPSAPRNYSGTHVCYRLTRPQGHTAAGRIKSMKNSNDTIWK